MLVNFMLEVTAMDHDGRGIAKENGKVVFINNALPGEIVEIIKTKEKKNYIEANTKSIIKSSKDRRFSPCKYFTVCGGCDIMHLSYEKQLIFKKNKIINIVKKYLNDDIKINDIVECDNEFFYRNKTTFQVNKVIGLYKKSSYDIVQVDKCIISDELINNAIKYLKKLDLENITKIICRTNSKELMIIIETTNNKLNIENLKQIASSIYLKIKNNYILVHGRKQIIESLGEFNYIVSPNSFFQVNLNTSEKLYNKIKEHVGKGNNILDLYCGTGSIGIFVCKDNNVFGIEINESAIGDANKNKELNNIDNINFICGDSGKSIKDLKLNPNIIIVDPPRSGLNKETLNNLLKFKSEKIIYVSCDPLTMVRDLNFLNKYYDTKEITPFDMFPNTSHVECVCVLKLK